jgi:spore germination protein YaaH
MSVSRRRFLKLTLATASAAALAACGAQRAPAPTSTPGAVGGLPSNATAVPSTTPAVPSTTPPPTIAAPSQTPAALLPTATSAATATLGAEPAAATATVAATSTTATPAAAAASLVARNPKRVWGWLRMMSLSRVPSSEATYRANTGNIDVVMPLNGGKLQVDGKWLQEDPKLQDPWPQALPKLARSAGQLYMPAMGNDNEGLAAVLDSVGRQTYATEQLITLAHSRFDAPWDGVYLDLEGLEANYQKQMSGFLYRIAKAVKDAGLLLGVSVGGVYQDPDPTNSQQQQDVYGLPVVAEVADFVDVRLYDYWSPAPRSIAPYWWVEACVQYVLGKGIPADRLSASLANFSRYWVQSDNSPSEDLTYGEAMQMLQQAGVTPQWVERNGNGLVRENYAQLGSGHMWLHDAKTYQFGLDLVDQYKLRGNAVFTPGMGDPAEWQAIGQWRARRLKA